MVILYLYKDDFQNYIFGKADRIIESVSRRLPPISSIMKVRNDEAAQKLLHDFKEASASRRKPGQ